MQAKYKFEVGTTHQSKNNGKFKVISFRSASNVRIKFIETGFETTTTASALKIGNVKDKLRPSIFEVAYLGDGKYNTMTGDTKNTGAVIYPRWSSMLAKCYSKNMATNYASFGAKGYLVCREWHNFQNFAQWAERKAGRNKFELKILDGKKVFSPKNCYVEIK